MPWVLQPMVPEEEEDEIAWAHASHDDVPGWAAFWRPLPAPPDLPVRITKFCDRPLPDLVQGPLIGMLLVSERLRDLVEDYEPGYHHFLALEIRDSAGHTLPRTHWLFKPGPGIPGGIYETESNVAPHQVGANTFYLLKGIRPALVWEADRVAGRHVWTDAQLMGEVAVSDEFYAELKSRGLTGAQALESRLHHVGRAGGLLSRVFG